MRAGDTRGNSIRRFGFFALLSFIIALGFRLYGISIPAPQSDERHWVTRSHQVLIRLRSDPRNATTGIGHPGVPPALVMAAGQWVQEKHNHYFNLEKGDSGYLFKLDASRIAAALISALAAPVVFLGVFSVLGLQPALLAGFLIAVDPRHIGYSRMAHLDAVLTFLVVVTLFLYITSVRRKSLGLKLLAGAFWGLSIATKPTAGMLLLAFVLYKLFRCYLIPREKDAGERAFICWSDLGAFLVGHAVLAAIFTRLWYHNGEYRLRLQVKTLIAKYLWRSGRYLQHHPEIFIGIMIAIVLAIILSAWGYKKDKAAWKYHLSMFLGLAGILSLSLYLFPEVLENIARFWKWTSGLSGETHKAFGRTLPPVKHGYLWLFLSELPNLILLGIFLGITFFLKRFKTKGSGEGEALLFLCIICPIIWVAFLSVSSKQAWRYALPVVPCLYVVAGFGLSSLFKLISRRFTGGERQKEHIVSLMAFAVIGVQGALTYSWFPQYQIFFNNITGGVPGALKRRHGFSFVGQNEAVKFLYKKARQDDGKKFITVAGDAAAFAYTYNRLYPKNQGWLSFADYPPPKADYLVVFASHKNMVDRRSWEKTVYTQPRYSYFYRGVELLYLFESVVPDGYQKKRVLSLEFNHRRTGRLEKVEGLRQGLTALRGRDKAGFIFFSEGYRVLPGRYKFSVPLDRRSEKDSSLMHLRSEKVLSLSLNENCQREFVAGDLPGDGIAELSLVCDVLEKQRLVHQIEWFGKVSVIIGDPTFKRVKQ